MYKKLFFILSTLFCLSKEVSKNVDIKEVSENVDIKEVSENKNPIGMPYYTSYYIKQNKKLVEYKLIPPYIINEEKLEDIIIDLFDEMKLLDKEKEERRIRNQKYKNKSKK